MRYGSKEGGCSILDLSGAILRWAVSEFNGPGFAKVGNLECRTSPRTELNFQARDRLLSVVTAISSHALTSLRWDY